MLPIISLVSGFLVIMYHLRDDLVFTHRPAAPTHVKSRAQESSQDLSNAKFSPRCLPDPSAPSITDFSSLPALVQDFFIYRHCVHFPIILDVPDKCGGAEGSGEVFFLLVIKSSPNNYERREVLRKTWATERLHNGARIRRLFISGTSPHSRYEKQKMNQLLRLEHREHGDILQWDFDDTFYNLTLKQVLFLQWMERNCPHARFLFNGDDDVFANTGNMVDYLQGLEGNDGGEHLFTGYTFENTGPARWPDSKYYIPKQLQEIDWYPLYCGGGGILMSGYTATVIHRMSKNISLFPIDDVYLGMCLEQARLKPTTHSGMKTAGMHLPSQTMDQFDTCLYRSVLLVHGFLPVNIYLMWHKVNDPNVECSHHAQSDGIPSDNT